MAILTVVGARLARIYDSFNIVKAKKSVQDPFVVAEIDERRFGQTQAHKRGNLNPCWNEKFNLPKQGRQLTLKVFVEQRLPGVLCKGMRASAFCGEAYVDLWQAVPYSSGRIRLSLTLKKKGKPIGILEVEFQQSSGACQPKLSRRSLAPAQGDSSAQDLPELNSHNFVNAEGKSSEQGLQPPKCHSLAIADGDCSIQGLASPGPAEPTVLNRLEYFD